MTRITINLPLVDAIRDDKARRLRVRLAKKLRVALWRQDQHWLVDLTSPNHMTMRNAQIIGHLAGRLFSLREDVYAQHGFVSAKAWRRKYLAAEVEEVARG